MSNSERALWKAWRDGNDAEAFGTLVQPHLHRLVDLARRSGCPAAETDDVVQDVLVELTRAPGDEPIEVGLPAWLGRRAILRSRRRRRSAGRRARHEKASSRLRSEARRSPDPTARDEVEEALAVLPEKERQAVVLRYLHDLDYKEIGYVLGTSDSAARVRVHRGIGRLRARLGGAAAALVTGTIQP